MRLVLALLIVPFERSKQTLHPSVNLAATRSFQVVTMLRLHIFYCATANIIVLASHGMMGHYL